VNGKVIAGPAPRPLDRLPVKVENDHLFVIYKEFKAGTPQQIEL
jgi:menaquinol-cytochrome c reductase iron-sulfur subunit